MYVYYIQCMSTRDKNEIIAPSLFLIVFNFSYKIYNMYTEYDF